MHKSPLAWLRLATLLAACALASTTFAQVDSGDNAALRYWRAFAMLDIPAQEQTLDEPLDAVEESGAAVSAEAMLAFRHAASFPDCDFAPDYDLGPYVDLPHLSPMRRLVGATLRDAEARMDLDDSAGAADAIVASLRAARHTSSDRLLVSSLVSMSILSATQPLIERGIDQGRLDAPSLEKIADALAKFHQDDPAAVADALHREGEVMLRHAQLALDPGEDGDRVRAASRGEGDLAARLLVGVSAEQTRDLYHAVADAMGRDDAAALAAIEERVANGEFGLFARQIAPALLLAADKAAETRERFASMNAKVAAAMEHP